MRNGDRVEGKLVAMTKDSITMECDPLVGTVNIIRSEVTRLAQTKGGRLNFSGLGELSDWTSSGRDRKPTDWFTDLRGELTTHQWSGNLFRKITFPEKVEIHFKAEFPQGMPNLEVGLLRTPQGGPMLETWDNFLVLTYRTRFVPVMKLTGATTEIELRLFWNQATGEVRLCDPSGKEIASLDEVNPGAPDKEKKRPSDPLDRGFSILNHTPEIKLLSLGVREWDGRPAPVIDLTRPRLQLLNSPLRFQINDVSLTAGSSRLLVGDEAMPLENLLEMTASPEPGKATIPAPHGSTRIACLSGTTLSGDFLQIGSGEFKIAPPWSSAPVSVKLDDAREIRFPENVEPLGIAYDHLSAAGVSIKGTMRLASTGATGGNLFAWQAPGAITPVPLDNTIKLSITRSPLTDRGTIPQSSLAQARVYLNDDEILTGRLISVSPEKIQFESLRENLEKAAPVSQKLLIEETIDLSPRHFSVYEENSEFLKKIGFEIELFGEKTIIIRAVPSALRDENVKQVLTYYLEQKETGEAGVELEHYQADLAAMLACKTRSVKAHDSLTIEEMRKLVEELMRCERPFHCPHGRPSMLKYSFAELERQFKRKL